MWPGRRDDPHLEVADGDHVALAQALRAEPVRRVESADAAPGPLGERAGRLGVVEVVMRQEYDGHVARGGGDRVEVPRRPADPGRPRPTATSRARAVPRCSCRRASSATRWGRARTARRTRTTHPSRSRAPSLDQRRRATRGIDSVAVAPSPSTVGVNISTTRPGRRRHHVVGRRVLGDLEAGDVGRRHHAELAGVDRVARRRAPASRSPTTTRSTRRGSAGPPAGRRRRTRSGSAAARRPACTSPTRRRAGRCAARARAGRGTP